MEFKLLSEEKNTAKIEVTDPDDTTISLLVSELLKSSDVAEACYYIGHPHLDKPLLTVKTKRSKPQAAIKKAAEGLAEQYRELRKLLEKELK
jgi:DNA-directed RNA polymerase subunit L